MEMLETRYIYIITAKRTSPTICFVAVEECLEMLGVVLFLYALLLHLGSRVRGIQILVDDGTAKQRRLVKKRP